MRRRAAVAASLLLLLTGCGSGTHGTATLWVTHDRGADVVLVRNVPAGLTAMQALERVAKVSTRYGGRYVQAIDGVQGSLAAQHDWFYFINGYEADRSAAEYRLHPGDVEWWDFRNWRKAIHVPIVVGAYPEPFLHGWGGRRRPAVVEYDQTTHRQALAVARRLRARIARLGSHVGSTANVLVLECPPDPGTPRITASLRGSNVGDPVRFTAVCEPQLERRARFHFEVTS